MRWMSAVRVCVLYGLQLFFLPPFFHLRVFLVLLLLCFVYPLARHKTTATPLCFPFCCCFPPPLSSHSNALTQRKTSMFSSSELQPLVFLFIPHSCILHLPNHQYPPPAVTTSRLLRLSIRRFEAADQIQYPFKTGSWFISLTYSSLLFILQNLGVS